MSVLTRAITAYVLQKPFGANAEGDIIHMEAEEAQPLLDAGILEEASAEDVDGGDDDEDPAAADQPEENAALTRAVARLSKNLEAGIAKATELAVSKVQRAKSPTITVPATTKAPVFSGVHELMQTMYKAHKGDGRAHRMLDTYQSEMRVKSPLGANEGNTAQGGYFLKPEWYKEVWDKTRDYPKLLDRTERIPISGNTFYINEILETSLQDGSRHGGVLGYWVAEAAALTATYPATGQVTCTLNTNAVFAYATVQLLEDANIQPYAQKLMELAARELLWQEDVAVISGSGTGAPLGILNQASLVTVTHNSGDVAAMFSFADLAAMMARIYPPARAKAVWLMNSEAYGILLQLAFQGVGSTTAGTYPAHGLTWDYQENEPRLRLFGKEVIECLMSPQLGALGDIILADLSSLICVEKPQTYIDMSEHIQFNTMQVAYRFYRRYDVRSPWTAALTPADGATGRFYSCLVALSARGT